MEERIVIRRLSNMCVSRWSWYGIEDANGVYRDWSMISDLIGTENAFRYKTHITTKWDSKYKEKYSPNKNRGWRNKGQQKTREENKLLFYQILKEHGIKRFYTGRI